VLITRQKSPVFSIVSLPTDSVIVDHAVLLKMFTLRYNKPIRREILKNGKSRLHVMFYYYSACLHLGKTKENVRTVGVIYVLGFINTGYFTSDNVPDGIKNATNPQYISNIQLFSEMAKHKQEIIF
jgi:hypothetical protein